MAAERLRADSARLTAPRIPPASDIVARDDEDPLALFREFEAPVNLALSARNRSAAIRIPSIRRPEGQTAPEFRCPDPSCNGITLHGRRWLMATLDGIQNKDQPGEPLEPRHLRDDAR